MEIEATLSGLIAESKSSACIDEDDSVLVARITAADVAKVASTGDVNLESLLELATTLPNQNKSLDVFRWPHDVVAQHMTQMADAMEWRTKHGDYTQTTDGVFLGEGATIGEYASIDTSDGPIALEKNVKVGPFCLLAGPVFAGAGTRVIEHAALKDGVSLGHTT